MSALTDLLLQGPRSATELRLSLAISQATFSRLVAAQDGVVQFGKARATRYALLKPVRGVASFPLWRVDSQGTSSQFGVIYPCWPQGSCLVALSSGEWQWFDGLPWYLTDLRPQGFLGRAWGRAIAADINLPNDIRLWQENDVLYALCAWHGENAGGWIVGEENYQRWVISPEPIALAQPNKIHHYQRLAEEALAGELVGSSAGGEQPKFACYAQTPQGNRHVLVKFSVREKNVLSERWGDLLIAESIALSVLSAANITASHATAYCSERRQVFLESVRFDCEHARGRRQIVSLGALQSEYISSPGAWPDVARKLTEKRYIDADGYQQIERVWAFGRLIANSDMHAGNLSFYLSAVPMRMAPVYDMLPMSFAPESSGVMRNEAIEVKVDSTVSRAAWEFALPLASQFWQGVVNEARISAGFREIARGMLKKLPSTASIIQRLA
jgi:hypothetical protein